ncbi:MAG: hypothetical protein J1G30_02215 [Spirochaetales bacterium]|nr:hypothetical protein [Spirochaetales bacterium]
MKKQLFITVLFFVLFSSFAQSPDFKIKSANLIGSNKIRLQCTKLDKDYSKIIFTINPKIDVSGSERKGAFLDLTTSSSFKEGVEYTITFNSAGSEGSAVIDTSYLMQLRFNEMYTDKELGYIYDNGISTFRLFVPRGVKVDVVIFNHPGDSLEQAEIHPMKNDGNQVFEYSQSGELWGKYYGYRITERSYEPKQLTPEVPMDSVFADPYSKAIASCNEFPMRTRSLICDISNYDWEGTDWTKRNINSAIIMETHLKDITAHKSAKTNNPGTYLGMTNAQVGGINYLEKLGVNTVEFLPLQEISEIEAPEFGKTAFGVTNSWNVYSRNYWGYMTTNYFSPESSYASDVTNKDGDWNGLSGLAVKEMRDMVKMLHKKGFTVLMDVVYNHVSQNDINPLRFIDYEFYFKQKENTGCGNELESRRKMVRRLVVDSLTYWMNEYKIDGFRFDLATAFDRDTVEAIAKETRKINPEIFLIAEPWGGEGAVGRKDFQDFGWSYWCDNIRSAIRGGDNRPITAGTAFMLGNSDSASKLSAFWKGSAAPESSNIMNYIESHDDATLGDMMRILSGTYCIKNKNGSINRIKNVQKYLKLSPKLLTAHKIGAVSLFLCQGPLMMHIGQEWARGKIVPDLTSQRIPEVTTKGEPGRASDNVIFMTPSPNSYFADNETNYINFDYISLNQELFNFYQGLISLRNANPLLGNAKKEDIKILENANKKSLGVNISGKIFGFVNADSKAAVTYEIPEGEYDIVVNGKAAGTQSLGTASGGKITIGKSDVLVLIKK